jgi:hypothetical protein
LIDRYIYIDKLLDSTLPRDLLQTYHDQDVILSFFSTLLRETDDFVQGSGTDSRESRSSDGENGNGVVYTDSYGATDTPRPPPPPQRRRPSALYKIADEESPLLGEGEGAGCSEESQAKIV